MKNVPQHLKKLLWEYDIETLDKWSDIVMERTLSFGNMEDIKYVWLSLLKEFFKEKFPILDPKSHNFWAILFETEKSTLPPSSYDLINHPTSRRRFR